MWEKASAELKDKKNVVGYDLMVEPVVGPEKVADAAENGRRYKLWYDLANDIASAIRAAGDETPILVGGANASSACALECLPPLKLTNIVYTAHQYDPYTYTHQAIAVEGEEGEQEQKSQFDCKTRRSTSPDPKKVRRPRDAKQKLKRIYELLNGYRRAHDQAPVAINEFGVYRWSPDASKHLRDEMEYLERVEKVERPLMNELGKGYEQRFVPNRYERCRVESARSPDSRTQTRRSPCKVFQTRDCKRNSLRGAFRLCVATAAT
jgi:hypothetical protein